MGVFAANADVRQMGLLLTTSYGIDTDTHVLKALLLRNAMKVLKERPFYLLGFCAEMHFVRSAANKRARHGLSSKYTIQRTILTRECHLLNPKHPYCLLYSYCTHSFNM